MQTAMIRLYEDVSCQRLQIEAPISRAGGDGGDPHRVSCAGKKAEPRQRSDDMWRPVAICSGLDTICTGRRRRSGQQHLTRVQLRPAIGGTDTSTSFPAVSPRGVRRPLHLRHRYRRSRYDNRSREWLVTSTLAGVLHGDGVSLADQVIAFACGRLFRWEARHRTRQPANDAVHHRTRPWLVRHRRMAARHRYIVSRTVWIRYGKTALFGCRKARPDCRGNRSFPSTAATRVACGSLYMLYGDRSHKSRLQHWQAYPLRKCAANSMSDILIFWSMMAGLRWIDGFA